MFFRLARACRRLARLTMPTTLPSLTIGTRLMACLSRSSATSPTGVSSEAVTTFRLITSTTLRECDLMYSEAKPSLEATKWSHQE
jgi:hypothetical protein